MCCAFVSSAFIKNKPLKEKLLDLILGRKISAFLILRNVGKKGAAALLQLCICLLAIYSFIIRSEQSIQFVRLIIKVPSKG
jgi:hypothetical protein